MRVDPTARRSCTSTACGIAARRRQASTSPSTSPPASSSTMTTTAGRPSLGDYVGRPPGAALPRRPARHRHRGPDPADQRRRAGAPAAAPVATACRRPTWPRSPGRWPRDVGKRLREGIELEDGPVAVDSLPDRRLPARQGAGRGRAARGPQAHRAAAARRPSATRCTGWSAPQIGPIRLGDLPAGAAGAGVADRAPRRAELFDAARAREPDRVHGGAGDPRCDPARVDEREHLLERTRELVARGACARNALDDRGR